MIGHSKTKVFRSKKGEEMFAQERKGKNIEKNWVIGEEIGSGAFATLIKVTNRFSKKTHALKIYKKTKNENSTRIYLEIKILQELIHPNIMEIYEFYEDEKNFFTITEICEGGELFDQLLDKGKLSEEEGKYIIKQILSAVTYIHSKGIVHRDLKLQNILLDTDKNNIIKIIDFNTARYYDKRDKMNIICGTPYYIAPEVLFGNYDEKCDIWSCGIILYILLCGYPPFDGENDTEILNSIKAGKFEFPEEDWLEISEDLKDLISNMLRFNPDERFSGAECLNHKWFTKNQKKIDTKALENLNIMKNSKAHREIQQAVLKHFINNFMAKEEKNEYLKLFQSFDKNGDGVLGKEEIYEGYKQSNMSDEKALEKANEIMKAADIDNSGNIDYHEFLCAVTNKEKVLNYKVLEETFNMYRKDTNGDILINDIKNIFGELKDKKVYEEILKECDKNGDGKIDSKEFISLMHSLFK